MAYSMRDYLIRIAAQMDGIQQSLDAMQKLDNQAQQTNSSAKKGSANFKKFGASAKELSRSVNSMGKTFAKQIIGVASLAAITVKAARGLRELIKSTVSMSDNLADQAKQLNKTQEQARLHQMALASMGKTMEEINKSESLKKVYDDLIKLGEGMQFKKAKDGLSTINDVKNDLAKLKFSLRFGLAQTYEYFKVYASKPLAQLRGWIKDFASKLGAGSEGLSKKVGKALAGIVPELMRFGRAAWNTIKQIITWGKGLIEIFQQLTPESKTAALGIAAAIGIITGALNPVKLAILGLLLLIDDFVTWQQGGQSFFGDMWYDIISVLQDVFAGFYHAYGIIYDAVALIYNGVAAISKAGEWMGLWNGSLDYMDFKENNLEDNEMYKMFDKMLERREQSTKKDDTQGTTGDNEQTANVARAFAGYFFNTTNNSYPYYAGQSGKTYNETTENKNLTMTTNATINVNESSPANAATAAAAALAAAMQHNVESVLG